MEIDSSLLVAAFHRLKEDWSECGRVVEDCKELRSTFVSFSLRHIFREANGVAHRLAHLANSSHDDFLYLDETPEIIQDVLVEDSCTFVRGLGSSSPGILLF